MGAAAPAVISDPPAAYDTRRDYPVMLGERLRESNWQVGQVELVGKIECPTPDPLRVLNIGNRYEVNHRQVRQARNHLPKEARQHIINYLARDDQYVERRGQNGVLEYVLRPPPMLPEERAAGVPPENWTV